MIKDNELIALFNAPTRVLKAERLLRKDGFTCRLIPAPREVAEGCALALRFSVSDQTVILAELARHDLSPRRMYRKQDGGFLAVPVEEQA
jgi:hypothetical protein